MLRLFLELKGVSIKIYIIMLYLNGVLKNKKGFEEDLEGVPIVSILEVRNLSLII